MKPPRGGLPQLSPFFKKPKGLLNTGLRSVEKQSGQVLSFLRVMEVYTVKFSPQWLQMNS